MLTETQVKTLSFIKKFAQENGYSPTIAEIAKGLGIKSRSSVHRHIQAIELRGKIKIIPNKRRNIQICDTNFKEAAPAILPILGKIAAGQPIEAINYHDSLNLTELLAAPNRYALKVEGDSMVDDNICDGDWVICEQADTARSGTIVVALIDQNEATLKRIYYNADGTVTLMPANARLKPMIYAAHRVVVQAIFIGLIRLHD